MPETPENWKDVMKDMDRVIKPGMTHWQSPNMHAYYPTASSFPSMVGDMLCNGFSVIGFSWVCLEFILYKKYAEKNVFSN